MSGRIIVQRGRRRAAFVCLMGLLATACAGEARDYDQTRAEPEPADVIGVWVPDEATREYLRGKGHYDTSRETALILEGGGEVKVVNMPDWWNDGFGTSHGTMQSEQGSWRLYESPGSRAWEVRMALPSGTKFMSLLGQRPPYKMSAYVGDPDSGEAMTFTRKGG